MLSRQQCLMEPNYKMFNGAELQKLIRTQFAGYSCAQMGSFVCVLTKSVNYSESSVCAIATPFAGLYRLTLDSFWRSFVVMD